MDHRFKREMPHDSLYNGMVSYWKLEEASGVRADELGTHPLAQSTNDPARATGIHGFGVDMDKASTNQLSRANASAGDLKGSSGSWTFAMWIKIGTPANNNALASCWSGSGGDRAFRLVTKGTDGTNCQIRFQATQQGSGGSIQTAGDTSTEQITLANDTWHHYVAQHRNGTDIRMRVNNSAWIETAFTGGVSASGTDFYLGQTFDGMIDEAAWWSRALTDLEIYWLYGNGKPLDLFSV